MNQRLQAAHDHMVRSQHGDSGGEENKARHNRQDAPDHAQNQQADAKNRPRNVPHVSHYFQLK